MRMLVLLAVLSLPAAGAELRAQLFSVHESSEIEPLVTGDADYRAAHGHLREQRVGETIFWPVVVEGYRTARGGMNVEAVFRFVSPKGKELMRGRYKPILRGDPRLPGTVVLVPVLKLTAEPRDPPGVYKVQVKVRDNLAQKSVDAEQTIELVL